MEQFASEVATLAQQSGVGPMQEFWGYIVRESGLLSRNFSESISWDSIYVP